MAVDLTGVIYAFGQFRPEYLPHLPKIILLSCCSSAEGWPCPMPRAVRRGVVAWTGTDACRAVIEAGGACGRQVSRQPLLAAKQAQPFAGHEPGAAAPRPVIGSHCPLAASSCPAAYGLASPPPVPVALSQGPGDFSQYSQALNAGFRGVNSWNGRWNVALRLDERTSCQSALKTMRFSGAARECIKFTR